MNYVYNYIKPYEYYFLITRTTSILLFGLVKKVSLTISIKNFGRYV